MDIGVILSFIYMAIGVILACRWFKIDNNGKKVENGTACITMLFMMMFFPLTIIYRIMRGYKI